MPRAVRILRALVLWPLLAALVLELCARLDDYAGYGAPLLGVYNNASLWEHDRLGQRGKPHARYLKWNLNSAGFRTPEPRPGALRIATLGASETFGLYEAEGNEWPRQLERLLQRNTAGGVVEVDNLALPGILVSTTRKRLPEMLEKFSPRVAVLYPSPTAYLFRDYAPEDQKVVTGPAQRHFEFRMKARVETIAKRVVPQRWQHWYRARQVAAGEARQGEIFDRAPQRLFRRYREDLAGLVGDLRAAGVEPVLVTHATLFGDHVTDQMRPWLTAWRLLFPTLREDGFLDLENRANAEMRELAAEQSVALVDAAAGMRAGPENFADFVHFTDRGAAEFAALVAHRIGCVLNQPASCLAAKTGDRVQ